jgi:hypothetical protein
MTEQDLQEAGFERITVPNTESQNGYDYHFYTKELWDDVSLYADNKGISDSWCIECYQLTNLKINYIEDFYAFVDVLDKIMVE